MVRPWGTDRLVTKAVHIKGVNRIVRAGRIANLYIRRRGGVTSSRNGTTGTVIGSRERWVEVVLVRQAKLALPLEQIRVLSGIEPLTQLRLVFRNGRASSFNIFRSRFVYVR